MHRLHGKSTIASLIVALAAATVVAPPASGEVTYTPLYWQLLDKYASVEANWAPIRGVYGQDPECSLAQQRGEPIGCGQVVVIMYPDGRFGAGWEDDPAAPNGWREATWEDCLDPYSLTVSLALWC